MASQKEDSAELQLRKKQGAPESIEELVDQWSSRIEMLAKRYGFHGEELEDIKSMIFLQFFEGGYLEIYDPRMAKFSTFMYNFIIKRLLQLVSKKGRDPISGYVPLVSASSDDSNGEAIIELISTNSRLIDDQVQSTAIIQEIRVRLGELPQRGKRNLLALFDMLILDWPRSEIANELGVSEATVCLMIKDLRDTSAVTLLRWD